VKGRLAGNLTTKEIMEKYNIKNKSQITTWMKWYRNNEFHRFDQPVGKQYTYGHGPKGNSEQEIKDRKMMQLEMENDILKKFMELAKELNGK
jgi:transposase